MSGPIRLYVDHPLGEGQSIPLDRAQAHYLFNVMRRTPGDPVLVFNGTHGEWATEVAQTGKKGGSLLCQSQTQALTVPPDLWLIFAPLKKTRTDFLVEKAVELGVRRLVPVQTDFTNADRLRPDKVRAHIVEAAEQCGATYLPELAPMTKLGTLLDGWDSARQLVFCDEALATVAATAADPPASSGAILIGPEGGFSEAERQRIRALPNVMSQPLGPRILRAETAAVAALTLWQSRAGDWIGPTEVN